MTHDNPIMMSAPMVQACLRQVRGEPGGKTQTRRMPTKQWDALERRFAAGEPVRLWVRETVACGACAPSKPSHWSAAFWRREQGGPGNLNGLWYAADGLEPHRPITERGPWTPAIHMPRWASRLTLLDVTIRRERLGHICEADARAEGIVPVVHHDSGRITFRASDIICGQTTAIRSYQLLWEHLHGPNSWERDMDKEVMVIGFWPVLGNIDEVSS